jgi:hypothetical protein
VEVGEARNIIVASGDVGGLLAAPADVMPAETS